MVDLTKIELTYVSTSEMVFLFGTNDKYLRLLEELYKVPLYANGHQLLMDTEDEKKIESIKKMMDILLTLLKKNIYFNERDIIYIFHMLDKVEIDDLLDLFLSRKEIIKSFGGKPIYPKTLNQRKYIDEIEHHTLTFGIGPAGTGKTYLAVLVAIKKLKANHVKKIILSRPAVEAGENLGFLPGDLKEKVDPYLRPLYDALYDILGLKQTEELIEKGIVEIAPLAYMRGRTLENAFVILDEAQNTTSSQMKLFLTRLGFGSKMVITGDITQTDLPKNVTSGLVRAASILEDVNDISIQYFENIDVVRHPLVQTIIERFENANH